MPLSPLDARFVRKLCLLCCHCVRNIAYYRVGFVNEDGSGYLKQRTQFGATVNGNMLDIAVLEWCKLFADRKARHHWKRFVHTDDEQRTFLGGLVDSSPRLESILTNGRGIWMKRGSIVTSSLPT